VLSPAFKKFKFSDTPDLKGNATVSRMAATEGMVLLKNNNAVLPLKKATKITLLGNTSYDLIAGGTGSGDVNKAYTISILQGLKAAGFAVNQSLADGYRSHIDSTKSTWPKTRRMFQAPPVIAEKKLSENQLSAQAELSDVAMITVGRNAGEGADRKLDNDYYLSVDEKELIRNASKAFHQKGKKVIAVLNIGGVIEVASWRDQVDGILLAWQPGLEGGNAITDVLSGKVTASGKLATTFPVDYKDVPSAKNFPGTEDLSKATGEGYFRQVPAEVIYEDGIYVGYRYYDTFKIEPAYPFGFGLSYTTFTYSNLKLSSPLFNGKVTASIVIKNTGGVAGKEIAQLYLSAPVGKLAKPSIELKAFAKTRLLQPGESQTLTFEVKPKDLASFDTSREEWIADSGSYTVRVGSSSVDIKQVANFKLNKELVVEKVTKALTPQIQIKELNK
ncbi:MAG: beta-glucosidase, partial [Pedobacter sp.]